MSTLLTRLAAASVSTLLLGSAAQAAEVTLPRWSFTYDTPTGTSWEVVDAHDEIRVTRVDGLAGFVLGVHPDSGCAAAVDTPGGAPLLPAPWRYAGHATGVDRWCLPVPGGTLELAFVAPPEEESVAILTALGQAQPSADAQPPAVERKPRYSLLVYRTMRHRMPPARADVVPGRGVIRGDIGIDARPVPKYGSGPGVGYDLHAMRLLAVGLEAGAAVRSIPEGRAGVAYHTRVLAGVGGWPVDWLGGAALVGVGVDGLTAQVDPAFELPGEAVMYVGASRFGAEVLARADLGLGKERARINTLGPFDGSYLRVAAWFGEAVPQRGSDYLDYGRRSFWVGAYTAEEWGGHTIGVTAGYALTALPIR